jgi:hypothetical protein
MPDDNAQDKLLNMLAERLETCSDALAAFNAQDSEDLERSKQLESDIEKASAELEQLRELDSPPDDRIETFYKQVQEVESDAIDCGVLDEVPHPKL